MPTPARVGVALAGVLLLAACGSDGPDGPTTASAERPTVTVLAAASLTEALTACTKQYAPADVRLSFGGSDELAAQIRRGVGGDLLAAANTTIPEQLAGEGKVEAPVGFAANELVLAVPARDARLAGLEDLAGDASLKLAIGSESVPVGSYTRKALDRLPAAQRDAVLDRVRTEEPDVKSVLAKLQRGVVDAAFVYRTDVQATKGAVVAISLPDAVRPTVAYDAAVIRGGNGAAAAALLEDLRSGGCQDALRAAGFRPPVAAG
ncbi:MAG: molybdate ABC transporter substrate-binding protein [Patulibacter sp.]